LHLGEVSPVGGFVGVGVKDGDDVLACTDRQPRKGVLGGLVTSAASGAGRVWRRRGRSRRRIRSMPVDSDRGKNHKVATTSRPGEGVPTVAVHLVRRGGRRLVG
jgi:hypothetical protein